MLPFLCRVSNIIYLYWRIEIEYQGVDKTVEKEDRPALIIPDNDPQGIKRDINIEKSDALKNIEVTLDIVHSFIRDLRIERVM